MNYISNAIMLSRLSLNKCSMHVIHLSPFMMNTHLFALEVCALFVLRFHTFKLYSSIYMLHVETSAKSGDHDA